MDSRYSALPLIKLLQTVVLNCSGPGQVKTVVTEKAAQNPGRSKIYSNFHVGRGSDALPPTDLLHHGNTSLTLNCQNVG